MTDDPAHVRLAVCQIDGAAARSDRSVLRTAVREAAQVGARLVVLPELAACGGVITSAAQARTAAEPLDGPTVALCAEISAEHGLVVVVGLAEAGDAGAVHNTAVVLDRGDVVATYRKAHLWGAEKDAFEPGVDGPRVVRTSAGRIGLMICYDLEFPEWVRLASEDGAEVVVVPANWPLRPIGDHRQPFEILKARAAALTYRVNVAVADRCGVEDGVDWYGGSLVCDVDGTLLAGPACADAAQGLDGVAVPRVLVADVDLAAARVKRLGPFNDALADRRPDLYGR